MHWLRNTIAGAMMFSVVGCGTLFYPERQGQTTGKIDPTVLILDGIGLFFFIIPGLVAFAVDFGTGTIYLPPETTDSPSDVKYSVTNDGSGGDNLTAGNLTIERMGDNLDIDSINRIIARKTAVSNVLANDELLIQRIQPEQLSRMLGQMPGMPIERRQLSLVTY